MTCGECEHFHNGDDACFGVREDDDATDCCGFVDHHLTVLFNDCFHIMARNGIDNGKQIILGAVDAAEEQFRKLIGEENNDIRRSTYKNNL